MKGERFNMLEVVKLHGSAKSKHLLWECICDCGNTRIVKGIHLRNNQVENCGCRPKTHKMKIYRQAHYHEYRTWQGIKERCNNPNCKAYHNYGGRGISICDRWLNSFMNFYEDMGDRPENTTLDRKNNELGYYKENCRWATISEQSKNKRTNKHITYNDSVMTISEFRELIGVPGSLVYHHLKTKTPEEVINFFKNKGKIS
jgi:hypothetical protein|nr:MAG TPA: hypothetical protein [Caudoviricetes sp.]